MQTGERSFFPSVNLARLVPSALARQIFVEFVPSWKAQENTRKELPQLDNSTMAALASPASRVGTA